MITDISKNILSKILRGKKKISYRAMPVEIKLQTGCFFDSTQNEIEFMLSMIEDIQLEIDDDSLIEIMNYNSFDDETQFSIKT